MEKTNQIVLTTILVMFVLAVLPVVSAATMDPIIYAPVNSTNHTGTVTVNCTTEHEVTNVSVWYGIGSTAMVQLGSNLINSTVNDNSTTDWNGTLTITAALDGIWNVSCKADNGSVLWSPNATVIMFDTTDPVCSLTKLHSTFAWKGVQEITWASSDTRALKSTAVYVGRPEGASTLSYTDTSRTLVLTSQNTKYIGDWDANITGTDTTGNTCTASVTFKSYLPDGEIWEPTEPPTDTGKNLLLLIIVGVVLWIIFGKKK